MCLQQALPTVSRVVPLKEKLHIHYRERLKKYTQDTGIQIHDVVPFVSLYLPYNSSVSESNACQLLQP